MSVPSDTCLLVADWGVGDHYIVSGFAEAVRRNFGLKVWIAGKRHLGFLPGLFPGVERTFEWDKEADAQALSSDRIVGGRMFYAHFPRLELMRAVGYNGFHFLDAYRCRLGLPPEAVLSRPQPPSPAEIVEARRLLELAGCRPGSTVVLGVDARTTPTTGADEAFWQAVAGRLTAVGLQVVVNASPETSVPGGLPAVSVPLALLRALVLTAGFCCSVRSGLSDLVCDLRCPQAVVFPDVKYWSGSLREGTSFARFGLTRPVHEVVLKAGQAEAVADDIGRYFEARRPPARS